MFARALPPSLSSSDVPLQLPGHILFTANAVPAANNTTPKIGANKAMVLLTPIPVATTPGTGPVYPTPRGAP